MQLLTEILSSRKNDIKDLKKIWKEHRKQLNEQLEQVKKSKRSYLSEVLKNSQNFEKINIIAELKAASPSIGQIMGDNDIEVENDELFLYKETYLEKLHLNQQFSVSISNISEKIKTMLENGVNAISVLTVPCKFKGSFGNLAYVNNILPKSVPLLQKDFILDEIQLKFGRIFGASNILIISKLCNPIRFAKLAKKYDLEPLIEIHDKSDLKKITPLKYVDFPFVIGINNRNLKNLEINLDVSQKLFPKVRKIFPNTPIISESGIQSYSNLYSVSSSGLNGALIGTSITRNGTISQNLKFLLRKTIPFLKICGVTTETVFENENFYACNAIGVVHGVSNSHRNLDLEQIEHLFGRTPRYLSKVIVVKDIDEIGIRKLFKKIIPDFIQLHGKSKLEALRKYHGNFPCQIILAIEDQNEFDMVQEILPESIKSKIFAYILDSSEGKGTRLNIHYVQEFLENNQKERIIIAGGIDHEILENLSQHIKPFGIDCSSSLENEKGKKDKNKIDVFLKKFIEVYS